MRLTKRRFLAACALSTLTGGVVAGSGGSSREIVIGQFAALTGPAAELGKRMQMGIRSYFDAVNAQGGVNGRTIKLISRDDGYEPERAATAVKALIEEDRVFALIGSVGTPTTLAAMPAINAERISLIGPFTGAQALRDPFNRNIFHVRASYFDETERMVQHLTTLGIKRVGVFYQNDSYGKAGLEGVTRALTRRDLKPAVIAAVERNTVDVGAAMSELMKVSPEAIIQISAYKTCAALIRQSRAKGYGGQFFNVSFVGSKALAEDLGEAGVAVNISQVVPFPYTGNSPVVRDYQKRMNDAGEKELDFTSMEGYLAARVLVEGLQRAGSNLTREGLVKGLESLRDFDLGGFRISYSADNHEGSRFTDLTSIGRNGRFVK